MTIEELILKMIDDQPDEEIILREEDAVFAKRMTYLPVVDEDSAFLFFASMNFLNAYVKKDYAVPYFRKKYYFKEDVARILETLVDQQIEGIQIHIADDVTYVSVKGLQFSFHQLDLSPTMEAYRESDANVPQEWTQLRLQPYAKDLLDTAVETANEGLRKLIRPVDPVLIFKALGDPIRYAIYTSLTGKECCACNLLEKFSISQPTLSHHMHKLVDSGIITVRKDGIWMRYAINPIAQDQLKELFRPLKFIAQCEL